jgi:hypothetical protein
MESYQGGFSSSALATRRVLALDQAHGIYLTDRRLIVTKEKNDMGLSWEVNGTSMFGTLTTKVKPFFDATPRKVEELDTCPKKLEAAMDQVVQVELKHPSFFSKGHIIINLKSGKPYKLLLLKSTEEYVKESYDAAKELFQKKLSGVLRET